MAKIKKVKDEFENEFDNEFDNPNSISEEEVIIDDPTKELDIIEDEELFEEPQNKKIDEVFPTTMEYIEINLNNSDYIHIEEPHKRLAAQFRVGQFFKNSAQGIFEIIGIQEGHLMFKFIKGGINGKRIFPVKTFAQLFINKYFVQMKNPDQKHEWELTKNLELERFLR